MKAIIVSSSNNNGIQKKSHKNERFNYTEDSAVQQIENPEWVSFNKINC